ncbi:hypothetical protein [Ensifer sp. LBL]|uniref:hypothetical protein n=1 Tax=Ensifer sp. LBL TaxID=2991056 RepID=UPI003D1AEC90
MKPAWCVLFILAAAIGDATPGMAQQQCAPNYTRDGFFIEACRGNVHDNHGQSGFVFTTSSIRRNNTAGNVDVYESCVKNSSGRALALSWYAAGMDDVMIPDGCAFRKQRPANYPKPGAQRPDFVNTCIRYGNRWQHEEDANYLPTPKQMADGFPDISCAGQVRQQGNGSSPESGPGYSEFLRRVGEFFWRSFTVLDADPSEQSQKLVAFIVDTRFVLGTEAKTYNYTIDFRLEELDPGAFALVAPGFELHPPFVLSMQFEQQGWNAELARIRPNERKSFAMTLPYNPELDLGEDALTLRSLGEDGTKRALFVPVLE